ncbi:hypothetical protein Tco_0557006 [Tanacetum coccineum]
MPEDPYGSRSLRPHPLQNNVLGPKEARAAPPSPDIISSQEHTDDELLLSIQPGAEDASPRASSHDYVPGSDPEADPGEYDDENHAMRGEEEEHLAPADSVVVALPAGDQAPSVEETELFETNESAATPPPHPTYRVDS